MTVCARRSFHENAFGRGFDSPRLHHLYRWSNPGAVRRGMRQLHQGSGAQAPLFVRHSLLFQIVMTPSYYSDFTHAMDPDTSKRRNQTWKIDV